jgi:UDP-N-acetylmuramate dehydrogenase
MPKFQENIPLSKFSNYKIGGPARFFFEAKSEKETIWAAREARKKKLKIFVLSGGTNLLIGDEGFNGLVLRPNIKTLQAKNTRIEAGAGVLMADLLKFSVKKSLSGLEWAGGLPGALGGAIRGNAGCFGGEVKDVIRSVRSFDLKKMKVLERSARSCKFGYRNSFFKKNGTEVILSAMLQMEKGNAKDIALAINKKIEYRKAHHPLEHANIGSIFKNVPLEDIHKIGSIKYKQALANGSINFRGSAFSVKTDPFPVISAAKLISESGLRGVSFGGAMIAPKHPNFIVNVLAARGQEVKQLVALAKGEVRRKFGIKLEEEVQIV